MTEIDTSPFLVIRREEAEMIAALLRLEAKRIGLHEDELRLAAKLKKIFGIEI